VEAAVQQVIAVLWVGVIPALSAGLVLRYLVPPVGVGFAGLVALLGHRFGLYLGVALFFVFTALVRYWRYWIPGGRYASALPAHVVPFENEGERLAEWADAAALYDSVRCDDAGRRIDRVLGSEKKGELDRQLLELRAGIETGNAPRARLARQAVESMAAPVLGERRRRHALGSLATVLVVAGIVVGVRAKVVAPYEVVGLSMLPTLEPDDYVAGNELAYGSGSGGPPRRGDVVVFRSSAVSLADGLAGIPDLFVKRVVGLPGDRVAMRGGVPVINGWPVPTCDAGDYVYVLPDASGNALRARLAVEFLDDRSYLTVEAPATPSTEPYQVQPREVFVLGDNRRNSVDSRAYNKGSGGGVPMEAIQARVQWFLLGTHRGGDLDFDRLLRPVDRLQVRLRLEGLETQAIEEAILRCLRNRPPYTRPPPP
jgi:signal peptidase I